MRVMLRSLLQVTIEADLKFRPLDLLMALISQWNQRNWLSFFPFISSSIIDFFFDLVTITLNWILVKSVTSTVLSDARMSFRKHAQTMDECPQQLSAKYNHSLLGYDPQTCGLVRVVFSLSLSKRFPLFVLWVPTCLEQANRSTERPKRGKHVKVKQTGAQPGLDLDNWRCLPCEDIRVKVTDGVPRTAEGYVFYAGL